MRLVLLPVAFLLVAAPASAETAYTGWSVSLPAIAPGPAQIPATLLKPDGAGPFPAVIIAHDCSGLGPRSSGAPGRWGKLLAGDGYVVIIPDSFMPRDQPEGVCVAQTGRSFRDVGYGQREADIYAALAYLRTLPYVDGAHVGMMGGSHGGSTTLFAIAAPVGAGASLAAEKLSGLRAAVALYPRCGWQYGAWGVARQSGSFGPVTAYLGIYKPVAPLLILIGDKDDWTPAADCVALAERAREAGHPVTLKVYPGAHHAFDSRAPVRYVAERYNVSKPDRRGATTGGDPSAWADSIVQVRAFFAQHLKERS